MRRETRIFKFFCVEQPRCLRVIPPISIQIAFSSLNKLNWQSPNFSDCSSLVLWTCLIFILTVLSKLSVECWSCSIEEGQNSCCPHCSYSIVCTKSVVSNISGRESRLYGPCSLSILRLRQQDSPTNDKKYEKFWATALVSGFAYVLGEPISFKISRRIQHISSFMLEIR